MPRMDSHNELEIPADAGFPAEDDQALRPREQPTDQSRSVNRIVLLTTGAAVPGILFSIYDYTQSHTTLALLAVIGLAVWTVPCLLLAQRVAARLERGVHTDHLTGLRSRAYFEAQLDGALAMSARMKTSTGVLMIDVDRFKEVNDTYGHQVGDSLLQQVAERLAATLRPYDTIARYGGEEFSIVLPHADNDGSVTVAERLRRTIAEAPFIVGRSGQEISVTVSIGYALFPEDALDANDLIHNADLALYTCKRYGRNQLQRGISSDVPPTGIEKHRELIDTLAKIVDLRDGQTGNHGHEVSKWSRKLGEALGLNSIHLAEIEAGALLHDIGKVGVPDGILRKPGKLNDDEWKIIKMHPEWGADIVNSVSSLERVASIVHQHQEWYDGRGYPFGLTGDAIEIGARIISVVDAYHAMTTDRPYRGAMSMEEATSELTRCAGSQFDPVCVAKFIELARSGALADTEGDAATSDAKAA